MFRNKRFLNTTYLENTFVLENGLFLNTKLKIPTFWAVVYEKFDLFLTSTGRNQNGVSS